eukprot:203292_1
MSHAKERFILFNTTSMSVDQTNRVITKTSHGAKGGATVYGMVAFGDSDNTKHRWVFKVNARGMGHMAIGIDNSNGKYMNVCPFTQLSTLNYSYWSSGKKCLTNNKSAYNFGWDEGDVIVMYYDSATRSLTFAVNNSNLKIAFKRITPSKIRYRMCVYMQNQSDCVSLLSYSCGDKISPFDDHKSKSRAHGTRRRGRGRGGRRARGRGRPPAPPRRDDEIESFLEQRVHQLTIELNESTKSEKLQNQVRHIYTLQIHDHIQLTIKSIWYFDSFDVVLCII